MMGLGKIAVVLAGGLALNAGLCAPSSAATPNPLPPNPSVTNLTPDTASSDSPYATIAVRNVFGLNPPQPVTNSAPTLEDLLPKITLQGIMGVFGSYQALFKVSPPKAAAADKDQYYILNEGQRQDDIEVVKIDYERSVVTFDNHGTTQELPLAEPSGSGSSGGAAPAASGGANPFTAARASVGGGSPTPVASGGANPPVAGSWGNNNNNPWANNTPGGAPADAAGGLNFGGSVQGHIYQPETTTMPPEAMQINLAGNHLKAQVEGDPSAPMFPPSAIDHEAGINPNTESNYGQTGH